MKKKKKKAAVKKHHAAKKSLNLKAQHEKSKFPIRYEMNLKGDLFTSKDENSTRQGFGEALVDLGRINPNVIVLTADLEESTRVHLFAKENPSRFFNVGIAEQNMLGIATGLSFSGKIPFASSFGLFAVGRAWDQFRTSICYAKANVKVAATHNGVTVGIDGATHEMLSDIALTRTIPNLTILSPCDYEQAKKATAAACNIQGPVYLRLTRTNLPLVTSSQTPFNPGKASVYAEGKDVAIIATGELVYEAMVAAKSLFGKGISAGVINMHTLKPLDEAAISHAAHTTRLIVTAEDHSKIGGLGSAVAEVLAEMKGKRPGQVMIGVDDVFGKSGEPKELMKIFHITSKDIEEAVLSNLEKQS